MSLAVLGLSTLALVLAALPWGLYLGMGTAIFCFGLAAHQYRDRERTPWSRLQSATAMSLSGLALLVSCGRYGAAIWALERLETLWS